MATPLQPLTIIMPALNVADTLPDVLTALGTYARVIVVDGGSADATVTVAKALGATVITSARGRGVQLIAGANAAATDWLLFLHSDTVLEDRWVRDVAEFQTRTDARERAAVFQFALDDISSAARRLERMVAWRTRTLGLPYGDQGLLLHRALYDDVGGFRDLVLMEDVDIARRIGRARLVLLDAHAITSARRWREAGWLWRSARNLCCLSLYFAGVSPKIIAKVYGR